MLEALPPGRPPTLVGPYRLLARLGAGGMGEVHLACRADAPTADPHRMVAVKTVRPDLEVDGDFRTRFRREIAAARTVDGPGVARLVDADADAASPWLATEYVPGPSLAEAVARSGPLPVAAVRALGASLAGALAGVHRAKVLHRDLKPANVLLGAAGPRLIDFGIAQAFEATALTSTGLVVGSPGFMSPEHLVGSRAVVPASDVFCLGAVLAFAATGRGPFHDDEMAAVVYRIVRAEADLDGVPDEVRPLVERCLRLDPAERPPAAELVGLLGGVVPEAFPWPGGVLSLLAEYGEAARRAGEAAASGAGVADLPTIAPVVPYSPTAMTGRPPVAPAVPVARRRPWGALVAGAVAVAVLVTAGAVLLDRTGGTGDGSAGPGAGGSATPSASASGTGSAAPRALSRVVLPYGATGRTLDFGAGAADRARRPAEWSPWTARTPWPVGACAVAPAVLVCAGSGGSAVGLRASDGEPLWTVPGRRDTSPVGPMYPAVAGDAVYLTDEDGIAVYGLADGRARGRIPVPDGGWAVKSTDLVDGVLYSAYFDTRENGGGLVTAVRLKDRAVLWRAPVEGVPEQLVAGGGRVLVPLGSERAVALDAGTGREVARAARACGAVALHERSGSVLCTGTGDRSLSVLDAGTLAFRRTLTTDGSAPPAVNADGLVAVFDGRRRLVTYDIVTGRERWRVDSGADRAYFAGDRLLTVSSQTVTSYPAAGPDGESDFESYEPDLPDGVPSQEFSAQLVATGGAAFLAFPGGLVVSGYLP
ncbi:protein kinase [Streptomyces sp. NPDC094049]|uniref:serine/threonine-protein kinase n=1 Tax=Streptomyces sp. NPDC094049 TaxID=3154987 RepID=UPI0033225A60